MRRMYCRVPFGYTRQGDTLVPEPRQQRTFSGARLVRSDLLWEGRRTWASSPWRSSPAIW